MSEELTLLVGDTIKSKRKAKNITLEQLATKAGVSKSLISQIENNRTVPSLPVMFNIIHSLGDDLKTFFEGMHEDAGNRKVLVVRKGEAKAFSKESVKGFHYRRIVAKDIASQAVDIALLELAKGAGRRQMIQTDAYECKYILKGKIEYQVEQEKFILYQGDALFFDGRAEHRLKNIGNAPALILIIYLF
jgi:transcriptional regulator with XRE-family HTH domain